MGPTLPRYTGYDVKRENVGLGSLRTVLFGALHSPDSHEHVLLKYPTSPHEYESILFAFPVTVVLNIRGRLRLPVGLVLRSPIPRIQHEPTQHICMSVPEWNVSPVR